MNERETTFEDVWNHISGWKGWLREDQAELLWKGAKKVKNGAKVVEIGSFHGKSTSVLLAGTDESVSVNAIDPHAGTDRGPGEWLVASEMGESDHERFLQNIRSISELCISGHVHERLNYVRKFSSDALGEIEGKIELLYIDGAHGFKDVSKDLKQWSINVENNGGLFIHDVFNSVGVTLAVFRKLILSSDWRFIARAHSMCEFEKTKIGFREKVSQVLWFLVRCPVLVRSVTVRKLQTSRLGKRSWISNLERGY